MYDPDLKAFEDVLAARYALGVASAAEIAIAERRIADDDGFVDRVAWYDALFSELEDDDRQLQPPPALWDRISATIDGIENAPDNRTVRPDGLTWEVFAPGIDRKVLHTDVAAGAQIVLYRVAPGTAFAAHGHLIAEECLVLEGEIEVDGVIARTGDVHIAFAATRHGVLTSRTGALLYIRADLQIQA